MRSLELLLKRLPAAAWLCALVALANGLAWSLITPPFEVPDENAHYAYVQQVAERGTPPHQVAQEGLLSPQEDNTLATIGFFWIVGQVSNPAPFSQLQQQEIEKVNREKLSALGSGNALSATNNPPLYYALQAIPYKLAAGGGVLERLSLMRVGSVLMGAVTVLLIFLFLRVLLPAWPWAWTTGALMVAFQPLFAFMSGGVNNDNLLYLAAAGVLWSIARAFRRGLDVPTGLALGLFVGLGVVSKLTLLGFLPAVALALLLLLRRSWPDRLHRRRTFTAGSLTVSVAAAPIVAYVVLNHLVWRRSAIPGGVGSVAGQAGRPKFNTLEELSHIWQLYLPRLGKMKPQFTDLPLWDTWFKGLVGRFGWLDYGFPEWTYWAALAICGVLITLALGEIVRRRWSLVRRFDELVVYVVALAGLCVEIGVQSYREYIQSGGQFEQPRYLLPLIGLYAAVAALAVRRGGARWGPVIAAGLVVLAIGHNLFAQAVTIARYYT